MLRSSIGSVQLPTTPEKYCSSMVPWQSYSFTPQPQTPKPSPLGTSRRDELGPTNTARGLVDVTFGSFSYCEQFPTILETLQQRSAFAALPTIPSPPRFLTPSTPGSCCSTPTIPSPFPEAEAEAIHLHMDADFDQPAARSNKKRKSRHQLINSPQSPAQTKTSKRSKATRQKKPRLEWVKKASFCSTEEQKAIKLISSLAPTGYSVVRNQPYKTKDGVVQVYKCSGKNRHGCGFQAKLIYFCPELDGKLEVFVAGNHWHPKPSTHTIGLPPILKPIVAEGVKDGLLPAQIHRKSLGSTPRLLRR